MLSENTYMTLSVLILFSVTVNYYINEKRHIISHDCISRFTPFIICLIVCTLFLSTKIQKGIFTIVLLNLLSGPLHMMSHHPYYISSWNYIGFQSSHDQEHHDSEVNKNIIPVAKEVLLNLISVSLLWLPLTFLYLDIWICVLWGLTYASFHNINQRLWPHVHEYHHTNTNINLGPDYMDILLHTKGNFECENMNTGILNLAVTTLTLYFIKTSLMSYFEVSETSTFSNAFHMLYSCKKQS